jgi:hypothetical protein
MKELKVSKASIVSYRRIELSKIKNKEWKFAGAVSCGEGAEGGRGRRDRVRYYRIGCRVRSVVE